MIKDNVAVKFNTSYKQYNSGEIAGFAPHIAKALVEGGAATYYKPRKSLNMAKELSEGDSNDARENPKFEGGDRRDLELDVVDETSEADPIVEVDTEKAVVEETPTEDVVRTVKHEGFGRWFVMEGDKVISGPHKKKEVKEMGLPFE